jgi:hypothetical protein
VLGENGILKQFTKALLERAMQVEMSEHLGYEKHDAAGDNSGNSRNGTSGKTMKGDFGELPIEVPRDRNSEFEPKIVPKGKTRLNGFNEKMLSLYARGMTTREIQQHIAEIYKVEVSPTLISNVTEAVTGFPSGLPAWGSLSWRMSSHCQHDFRVGSVAVLVKPNQHHPKSFLQNFPLRFEQYPRPQQVELRSSKHLTLDIFQATDLSLRLTIAPFRLHR